ncbi:hypothetical protein B0H15DRAFT_851563 [Mycena belliarum]|uniref:Uncharacterized protein n=1 Tax=Mycena belliarum TaxID=1033014 RepID=A0AAD6XLN8_9AGAR|nr:hypothetical protein B0H15DRAFT_851563 [Mycena belliae]
MLQTPSSVFSLVSLSSKVFFGLCTGVFIGSKIVFTQLVLSIPKNSLATRTTASNLIPTRCALSNPSLSVSCIAVASYVAVISAAVICILCAKGFRRAATGSQPPAPPPAALGCSSCGGKKKRGWTWLWLIAVLLGTIILGLGVLYKLSSSEEESPGFTAPWIQAISFLERSYLYGINTVASLVSAAKSHISTHGVQYAKTILLALFGHSICIAFAPVFERLLRYVVHLPWFMWLPVCEIAIVPAIIIGSTAKLNWIFWLTWYWKSFMNPLTVLEIQHGVHLLLARLTFPGTSELSISMVIGPVLVHTVVMGLRSVFLALSWMPCAVVSITQQLSQPAVLLDSLRTCTFTLAALYFYFGVAYSATQYSVLVPEVRQLVWKSFSCEKSRLELWSVYQLLLSELLKWKATQIEDFPKLVSTLWELLILAINLCARTWGALAWVQKLLVIVPAIVFYTFFYFVSHFVHLSVTFIYIIRRFLPCAKYKSGAAAAADVDVRIFFYLNIIHYMLTGVADLQASCFFSTYALG